MLGFTACDDNEEELETFDSERFYNAYRASSLYEDSDANQDGTWVEGESNENAFNTWDTNRDNTIDEDKFNQASTYLRVNSANWGDWDTDEDNNLNRQEFNAGYRQSNFYGTWKTTADGRLTERQFTDGTFNQMDASGTGQMTAADYNRFNTTYFRF